MLYLIIMKIEIEAKKSSEINPQSAVIHRFISYRKQLSEKLRCYVLLT